MKDKLIILLLSTLSLFIFSCNNSTDPDDGQVLLTGKIVFTSTINSESYIFTINPDGTDLKQHIKNAFNTPLKWSPDGKQIAFVGKSPYSAYGSIYIMNEDGSNVHLIPGVTGNLFEGFFPDWSPDGNKIAYTHFSNNIRNNVIVSLTDGNVLNLTNNNDKIIDIYPKWSPDGNKIAFLSNRDYLNDNNKRNDLYIMDSDGKNVKRLTEIGGDLNYVWYAPDQSLILSVNSVPGNNDINGIYKIETTGAIRILYGLSASFGMAVSNDGKHLVISHGGHLTVINIPVVNSNVLEIFPTNVTDLSFRPVRWSSDDKALLVLSSDYGSNHFYLDMINIYTNKDNLTLKRLVLENDRIFEADWHQ